MIHTSLIDELKRLDDIETRIMRENPYPITFEDKVSEQLRAIIQAKKHYVRLLAVSLGFDCYEKKGSPG